MLVVDVGKRKIKEVPVKATGAVDAALAFHNREESYKYDPYDPHVPTVFLAGPFAHPDIQGGNRGVCVFRSPLTGGIFTSTAGGLGRYIAATGEEGVAVVGRSDVPLVVAVDGGKSGQVSAYMFELDGINDLYAEKGVYSLIDFLLEELKDVYAGKPFRIVAAGPAAFHTDYGALVTVDPLMRVPDFFGRGGAGSQLVHAHNVVALAFGGDAEPDIDVERFIKIAEEVNGKPYVQAITEATVKYRFHPKEGIGGTMLNWAHLRTTLPAYNWNVMYMDAKERERLWEDYIAPVVEEMRKRFKDGSMKSKTCGEKCAAACKKVNKEKIDYEPITALGSQLGIFDLDIVQVLTSRADALGFDAIELGNTLAWALEARDRGDLSFDYLGRTSMKPFEVDFEGQAEAVLDLMERIAFGEEARLGKGIRRATSKQEMRDYGVYVPFSSGGSIVPPQYWVPGFLVPLPLHGKFMTYYKAEWLDPVSFGRKVWERFRMELMIENAGFCRFHRGWAEKTLVEVYRRLYNIDIVLEMERLATEITRFNKNANGVSQKPESKKSKDLIRTFAQLHGEAAKEWAEKLGTEEGIDEYFLKIRQGITQAKMAVVR